MKIDEPEIAQQHSRPHMMQPGAMRRLARCWSTRKFRRSRPAPARSRFAKHMNRNPNGNAPVAGMILAILALLSILGGLVALVNGVHEIYATLNTSGSTGNLALASVSGTVGHAMTGISSGVGMGLVGAILAFIALFGSRFSPVVCVDTACSRPVWDYCRRHLSGAALLEWSHC